MSLIVLQTRVHVRNCRFHIRAAMIPVSEEHAHRTNETATNLRAPCQISQRTAQKGRNLRNSVVAGSRINAIAAGPIKNNNAAHGSRWLMFDPGELMT